MLHVFVIMCIYVAELEVEGQCACQHKLRLLTTIQSKCELIFLMFCWVHIWQSRLEEADDHLIIDLVKPLSC